MANNKITFKEFKKISKELKVYDNLKFINATLGKELITTTLEGKSKTMTLAEWRLITATIKDKVLYFQEGGGWKEGLPKLVSTSVDEFYQEEG